MRDIVKLGLKLFLIAAIAGLALGATNAITAGPIEEQRIAEANAARVFVLPEAAEFTEMDAADGLDEIYLAKDASGNPAGLTGKITVTGFGGPIEITVGVGADGAITGVKVGGSDFAETAGLGAHTKDPSFAAQFTGKTSPIALKKNGGDIDAVVVLYRLL